MPDKTDEKQGKFSKGQSGNPLGRPRGIRNKAILVAEALFEGEIEGKGLKLQRSQFGQMLRNPVYMGKIYIPETENEEAHLVDGVHQAIVPTDLFWKVQKILNKRIETRYHLCAKEELPLRGHLKCPECGKNWTGSISSGNGG